MQLNQLNIRQPEFEMMCYSDAPGIVIRSNVKEPLLTGYAAIDALAPIRRSQRQLIIEDKGIGKTTLVLNIILNQKRPNRVFSPEGRRRDKV